MPVQSATTLPDLGTPQPAKSPIYPMPAPADDARFTYGLIYDVAKVLTGRGYPPIKSGTDIVRLQQALFHFLYTLNPTGPAESSLPMALADPGTPTRGEGDGQAD